MGWVQEEFETIDLSDVRLNTRAAKLAQRLAEKPSERIPNACQGWAETQAANRFLSSTNWSALMQFHWNATMKRMRWHEVVRLVAQLGGFLGRKHDGEPGAKTLWLGMRQLAGFVQGVHLAKMTL